MSKFNLVATLLAIPLNGHISRSPKKHAACEDGESFAPQVLVYLAFLMHEILNTASLTFSPKTNAGAMQVLFLRPPPHEHTVCTHARNVRRITLLSYRCCTLNSQPIPALLQTNLDLPGTAVWITL